MTVVAENHQHVVSEYENSIYRKITWKLIPFFALCYLFSYLDRINVGFAKLQMSADLGLSNTAFGIGAALFFVGYILFEVPSNYALNKMGAKIWIARIMITWGILSGLTMFVQTPTQFYIIRFLLGVAEAGFLPGVIFYLTQWYPSWRRSKIIAFFFCGIPLASIIGGPLSGWIMTTFHTVNNWHGWQWLFLLEAIPTVILGILTFWILPNSPNQAKWLSETEKEFVNKQVSSSTDQVGVKHKFIDGILNLKVWVLGLIDFALMLGIYIIGFWMPTFIKNTGVNSISDIGWLTAIPSIAGLLGMLVISTSSDYFRERRWHIIIPFIIGAIALASSSFVQTNLTLTILCFSIAQGVILGAAPVYFTLPGNLLKGAAAAAGFALATSIANMSGLVSNTLMGWVLDLTGNTNVAMFFFAGCLLLSTLLVLSIPKSLANK